MTYIEADHNILNCSALAWAAQPLANIKPKIGLRLLIYQRGFMHGQDGQRLCALSGLLFHLKLE